MDKSENHTKCQSQRQCKQVIIRKCLEGNLKACQVIKKAIEVEKNG